MVRSFVVVVFYVPIQDCTVQYEKIFLRNCSDRRLLLLHFDFQKKNASNILYLKWNLVVRWLVVVVFLCTYSTVLLLYYSTYRNFLKILSDDFAHALFLASGLTSENASKKNSPQAAERVGTLKC